MFVLLHKLKRASKSENSQSASNSTTFDNEGHAHHNLVDPREVVSMTTVQDFLKRRYLEVLAQRNFEGQGNSKFMEQRGNLQSQTSRSHDSKGNHQSTPPRGVQRGGTVNVNATLEEGGQYEAKRDLKCFVCADAHRTLDCPKFVNAANKVEILRHYKICIICLCHKFNAKAPKCRKQEYLCCDICQGKHETIMCGQDLRTLVEIKRAAEQREEPIVFIPLEQQDAHVHNVTLSEIVFRSTTGEDHETTALTLNETEHSLSDVTSHANWCSAES